MIGVLDPLHVSFPQSNYENNLTNEFNDKFHDNVSLEMRLCKILQQKMNDFSATYLSESTTSSEIFSKALRYISV
jgi:hypothetical protein